MCLQIHVCSHPQNIRVLKFLLCVCVLNHVGHVNNNDPMDCSPPSPHIHRILRQILGRLPCLSPGDFLDPGVEFVSYESLALAARLLPAPRGKPIL